MPPGDAQRAWFPEMINELRTAWSKSMTWEELAVFCERMTEKREQIRIKRKIKIPSSKCFKCGKITQSIIIISIRSALFALKDNSIVSEMEFARLDKNGRNTGRRKIWIDMAKLKLKLPDNSNNRSSSCYFLLCF